MSNDKYSKERKLIFQTALLIAISKMETNVLIV